MKSLALAAAAAAMLSLSPLGASAAPMQVNPAVSIDHGDVTLVRHGGRHGFGRGGRGRHFGFVRGRGHHYGWARGRHRGW